jgi:malate dehydrogenase
MISVSILGAGDLGGAVAQALAAGERVGRIVLIDAAGSVAAGKALDLQQSGAIAGIDSRLAGTDDLTRVAGTHVCVVADPFGKQGAEWHGEEGLAMLGRVLPYLSAAPIVFAGAAHAGLMLLAAREAKVPRTRLAGSAPEAFASAVRAIVALEARCSPGEVMLAVVGAPPFVVPWSEASIGGYALDRVLAPAQVARLEARAARLWPPGPYTLGLAAARTVEAVATASRRWLNVFTPLAGEFGVRNRIGAVPVLLNGRGIADVRAPALNTRERVMVETMLEAEL